MILRKETETKKTYGYQMLQRFKIRMNDTP